MTLKNRLPLCVKLPLAFLVTVLLLANVRLSAETAASYTLDENAQMIRQLNEQASNGNDAAKQKLHYLRYQGIGRQVDYINTFDLEKRVKNNPNDSDALCELGQAYLYQHGGLTKDVDKGKELLNRAAALNNNDAMWQLGIIHWRKMGLGIPQDTVEAEKWFKKLDERHDGRGTEELGWMGYYIETKDINETIAYFEKASQMGRHNGYCQIGKIYAEGRRTKPDQLKAVHYFAKAADMNCTEAAVREAEYHIYNPIGDAFKPDPKRAVKLLGMAVRMGSSDDKKRVYNMVYFDNKDAANDPAKNRRAMKTTMTDTNSAFVKRLKAIHADDKDIANLVQSFEIANKNFR
jgi:TPR repeat protein